MNIQKSLSPEKTLSIDISIVSYILLYLPVAIFFVTWLKCYLAIVAFAAVIVGLYFQLKDSDHIIVRVKKENLLIGAIATVMILGWLVLCGVGGITLQMSDFLKHNYMIKELSENHWPVQSHYNGRDGVLTYYLGSYIIPAIVGKLFGSCYAADITTLVLSLIQILIICITLYKISGSKNKYTMLLIAMGFIFFETFVNPIKDLYVMLFHCADPSSKLFSDNYPLVFPGNTSQMLWAYAQVIPGWLCTVLFIKEHKDIRKWGMIVFPLMFYSLFAFIGLFGLCGLMFFPLLFSADVKSKIIKGLFSYQNLASFLIAAVLGLYYSGSVLQSKPEDAHMGLIIIDHTKEPLALIFFIISWAIWWGICMIKEKDRQLLCVVFAELFLFSFIWIGLNNDFATRASICPIFVLCCFTIKKLISRKSTLNLIIAIFVVFVGIPELIFAGSNLSNGIEFGNRRTPYASLEEYVADDGVIIEYQYFTWDDSFLIPILK